MNPLQIDDFKSEFDSPIIVALDFPSEEQAITFIRRLDPSLCKIKIGNELFTTTGRKFVESLVTQGFKIFLDLKYHDIPNTVQRACQVAANMGVWMVNVHTSGGRRMMEAAANGLANLAHKPSLIGVTILTSMDESDLHELGIHKSIDQEILYLASLAQNSGLDGVVCSTHEVKQIKKQLGQSFITVTPGIRLQDTNTHDQKRIMTPKEAIEVGTDYMVIGRSITQTKNPLEIIYDIDLTCRTIQQSLANKMG
ncbi:orotidine-5'-phosphate decarboxylase [Neisseriaceae bacterium PsAf]|nr:orotidine-5'-phosphate decarboxylase [Neisseriaceae bacterium PsAf]MCV2503538.1 orotidine-5'-phosphate decarboxylase [Neisseriaceae bacterium]